MAIGRKDREGSVSAAEVSQRVVRAGRGREAAGASAAESGPDAQPADSQGAARAAPVQGIQERAARHLAGTLLPMLSCLSEREAILVEHRNCGLEGA